MPTDVMGGFSRSRIVKTRAPQWRRPSSESGLLAGYMAMEGTPTMTRRDVSRRLCRAPHFYKCYPLVPGLDVSGASVAARRGRAEVLGPPSNASQITINYAYGDTLKIEETFGAS